MIVDASIEFGNIKDESYEEFLQRVQKRFICNIENRPPLFTVKIDGIWDIYLDSFDPSERQYHNCRTCKQFIVNYGNIVTINNKGEIVSAIWNEDDAPLTHANSFRNLIKEISKSKIDGIFLTSECMWGKHITGDWSHLHIVPPPDILFNATTKSAHQAISEKTEDYRNIRRYLPLISIKVLDIATALLKDHGNNQTEKFIKYVDWLRFLHMLLCTKFEPNRSNLIWKQVAVAPHGFCHPQSSVINSLFDDIENGVDIKSAFDKFLNKIDPEKYMRATTKPTEGNIEEANRIIKALNAEKSFFRRYATLDEIQTIWKPVVHKEELKSEGKFFDCLKFEKSEPIDLGLKPIPITWSKFQKTILPDALEIHCLIKWYDHFGGFLTATYPEAPPIFQWDSEEQRNPFSWYVYPEGSPCEVWNLTTNTFRKVTGIALKHTQWYSDKFKTFGEAIMFIIDGAKDSGPASLGIFPYCLKSEFHSIRSTIEAFSKKEQPTGLENASACGIVFQKDTDTNVIVSVKTKLSVVQYKIDRWD